MARRISYWISDCGCCTNIWRLTVGAGFAIGGLTGAIIHGASIGAWLRSNCGCFDWWSYGELMYTLRIGQTFHDAGRLLKILTSLEQVLDFMLAPYDGKRHYSKCDYIYFEIWHSISFIGAKAYMAIIGGGQVVTALASSDNG